MSVEQELKDRPVRIYVGIRGRGDTADAYYRARAPWSVCLHFAPERFELTMGTLTDAQLDQYDVIWAQRPNSSEEELILRMAKGAGVPVIVDIDDNLFDIPPSAGDIFDHYHHRGQSKYAEDGGLNVKRPLAHHQRCLNLADVITVPTPQLVGGIARYIPAHPQFRVLGNCVMWADWDYLSDTYENSFELSVGWFGHFYHSHDLQWIAPVLGEVLEQTGAQLVLMGQPEATELFPRELSQSTFVENVVSYSQFSTIRQMIKTVDVGICPLMDIRFNEGKSWLKALQFGAAGVAPVCSAIVYDQLPELANLGLVAGSADEFGEILLRLLEDEKRRVSVAREWHEAVRRKHAYESLALELEDGRRVPNAMRWLRLAEEVARWRR